MSEPRDHSEHTAQLIDEEVGRILREADDRAFRLLEEHRDELERVTEALIEREVLSVSRNRRDDRQASRPDDPSPSTTAAATRSSPRSTTRRDRARSRASTCCKPSPRS